MSLKDADFFVQQTARVKAPQINTNKIFIQERKDGISFRIRVRASASQNEIKGLYGGALKIDINAPPVKGKANDDALRLPRLISIIKNA